MFIKYTVYEYKYCPVDTVTASRFYNYLTELKVDLFFQV